MKAVSGKNISPVPLHLALKVSLGDDDVIFQKEPFCGNYEGMQAQGVLA